jgi:predicted nucleic acid-binding protein
VVLADTSVWLDHLRGGNRTLGRLLGAAQVATHPFVMGELACHRLVNRAAIVTDLSRLPSLPVVAHEEAMAFMEARGQARQGIGWIEVHLLAAAALAGVPIWTLDQRLARAAARLRLAASL